MGRSSVVNASQSTEKRATNVLTVAERLSPSEMLEVSRAAVSTRQLEFKQQNTTLQVRETFSH